MSNICQGKMTGLNMILVKEGFTISAGACFTFFFLNFKWIIKDILLKTTKFLSTISDPIHQNILFMMKIGIFICSLIIYKMFFTKRSLNKRPQSHTRKSVYLWDIQERCVAVYVYNYI